MLAGGPPAVTVSVAVPDALLYDDALFESGVYSAVRMSVPTARDPAGTVKRTLPVTAVAGEL
jgi:hypothetical protein